MSDWHGVDLSKVPEEHRADIERHLEIYGPEELRPDLAKYLIKTDHDGVHFHHPLYISNFYNPVLNKIINRSITVKEKAVEEYRAERRWSSILGLHERPYRMQALKSLQDQMTDEEFWDEVSWLWTDSENIWENMKDWRRVWRSKRPGRERVMDDDERAKLESLPDMIDIYRGSFLYPWVASQGLSWTLDRDRAIWFAYRLKPEHAIPWLLTGKVRKRSVLAYLDRRSENEIVVLPERIKEMDSEELPMDRPRKKVSDSA